MNAVTAAISPFASGEKSGHSLIDDEFYFEFLVRENEDFIFYTSQISANRILKKFPDFKRRIVVLSEYRQRGLGYVFFALKLKISVNSKVIFFGYSERLVLIWYLINILKPFDLILVATNNISARRVVMYRRQLKFFFRVTSPKLKKLVLHTAYEVQLISELVNNIATRCTVKKHHLMIPKVKVWSHIAEGPMSISYFGPPKPEKPIKPLIDLITYNKNRAIVFKLCNVDREYFLQKAGLDTIPPNVELNQQWMSEEEYRNEFASSSLVLMTHTNEFEGKLSGNLCDCVAYGIPFIASSIEPLVAMRSRYGNIGFLCDFDAPNWPSELIKKLNRSTISAMAKNMRIVAEDHSLAAIINDLDRALAL